MKTMDKTNFNANDTMKQISHLNAIMVESDEWKAIEDILCSFGFDNDDALLSPGNLFWLCSLVMSFGIRLGIAKERARRKNGKKGN